MASKKEILERLDFVTDRISNQVRTLALGLLAASWGLFLGESIAAKSLFTALHRALILVGAGCILTLFLDFMQYVAAHADAKAVLRKMEKYGEEETKYDSTRLTYRAQFVLFIAKQVLITVATVIFLYKIFKYL